MELTLAELSHDDEERNAKLERPSLAPRLQPILERLMRTLTVGSGPLYFHQEVLDAIGKRLLSAVLTAANLAKSERKAFVPFYRE